MANPTSLTDANPATLKATPATQIVAINGDRQYTLNHDGEDNNGIASTAKIYLCTSGILVNNDTEGAGKAKLIYGSISRPTVIGPGVTSLQYAASGNGIATFQVMPGPQNYGHF